MVMVSGKFSSSHELHDEISLEKFCHEDLDDDQYHPIWSQLDIPQDNLEDIELFPNFGDDFMSLPEITFTPADYQSISLSLNDSPDRNEFYSIDHPSATLDNQNKVFDQVCNDQISMSSYGNHSSNDTTLDSQNKIFLEVCNNQSTSTCVQNRSQMVEVSDNIYQVCEDQSKLIPNRISKLLVGVCDNQNKSTCENHSDNTVKVRDYQSISTCENHSEQVGIFDIINYQSKICDSHSNTSGYSAMFYGQEMCGFRKKKMRSKRVLFPRCSTGPTENSKRTCTHCETETTPQWRMGPMGPNTLCNACGVRYQTGRLLPEYRPAASPTFDVFKHSNFHKRILKRKAMTS